MPYLTIISFVLATTISNFLIGADEKTDAERLEIEILKPIRGRFDITRDADRHITELRFDSLHSSVSDDQLSRLASLPHLESLHVTDMLNCDNGVKHLAASKSLKHLKLFHTSATDESMEHLGRMIGLETLDLRFRNAPTPLTNEGLAHLKNLTKLKKLILGNTEITDEGLIYLKNMKRVNTLILHGSLVTGTGFRDLKQLPLTGLDLAKTELNDRGLAEVGKFADLIYLRAGINKNFTGKGLEHLKPLRKMRFLDLMQSNVDDEGLSYLREMVDLVQLDLASTNVTDAGLDHLSQLGNLTFLSLTGTAVTEEGVKKLQQAHGKRLNIVYSPAQVGK